MLLVRDVLDSQILDRDGNKMGKVDGIVIEMRDGAPPRVVYLEAGATTLARRLGPRIARVVKALARRWSPGNTEAWRVAWSKVRQIDLDIHVDDECALTRVYVVERWLRNRIVAHIPGGNLPEEKRS